MMKLHHKIRLPHKMKVPQKMKLPYKMRLLTEMAAYHEEIDKIASRWPNKKSQLEA